MEVTHEGSGEEVVHSTETTSILIPDLHPDFSYSVRVAGHTVEEGPYSEKLNFRTLEDGMYWSVSTCSTESKNIVKQRNA